MISGEQSSASAGLSTKRAIRLGALAWVLALQFFVAQAIVQSAWATPYSLAENYISDLGNTSCGPYPAGSDMYVCSPWHALMNGSFILLGVSILLGAILIRRAFPSGRMGTAGLVMVALAGPGLILVGLFPENVNITPHSLGAALQFISGNLGTAVLGVALAAARQHSRLAGYSIVSGSVGVLATGLFVAGLYLGLGIGGMERVAAYALPIWLIVIGVAVKRRSRIRD